MKYPMSEFGYFQGNKHVWMKGIEGLKEIRQALQSKDGVCCGA